MQYVNLLYEFLSRACWLPLCLADHIAQIIELLGKIPPAVALSGKYSGDYFCHRGEIPLNLYILLLKLIS